MVNFVVQLVHGPGWDPSASDPGPAEMGRAHGIHGHARRRWLYHLGGPVGKDERTLHVAEAADENEVRARLVADPGRRPDYSGSAG
jgi:hypothetical protein